MSEKPGPESVALLEQLWKDYIEHTLCEEPDMAAAALIQIQQLTVPHPIDVMSHETIFVTTPDGDNLSISIPDHILKLLTH